MDEAVWKIDVPCEDCGDELRATTSTFKSRITYHYLCLNCNKRGPWTALAMRTLGHVGKQYKKSYRKA